MRKLFVCTLLFVPCYCFAMTDVECLSLAIFKEANIEPISGKKAVANVIINRSKKKRKSICNVVFERKQFSWTVKKQYYTPKQIRYNLTLAKQIITAENRKTRVDNTKGSLHFHSKKMRAKPRWAGAMIVSVSIGNHIFYKQKKNA